MNYRITQRIAIALLPFVLQGCGGEGAPSSTPAAPSIAAPSIIVAPAGFSDSVPLAAEKTSGQPDSSLQARLANSGFARINAPSKVLLEDIEGIPYVAWQPVADADFYSLYVNDGDSTDGFQLLTTFNINDALQYPIGEGQTAYVTATVFGIESKPSRLAASQLAATSRPEHVVFD